MADRFDWLFAQLVSESEMDDSDAALEAATRDFANDWDLVGIADGLTVAYTAPYETYNRIAVGYAYDQAGRRIPFEPLAAFSLDLQRDGNTTIGDYTSPAVADGNDIRPGVNQERWVSVYIESARLLSDERIDGAGESVYFSQGESFSFYIKAGTLYGMGGAPSTPDPALEDDKILLCDSLYRNTAAFGYHIPLIDFSRRMSWLNLTDPVTYPHVQLSNVTPLEAVTQLLQAVNEHIAGNDYRHDGTSIDLSASSAWLDATTNPADSLQVRVNKIITDLIATVATHSGADRIGASALTGAPVAVPAGSITSQLQALLDEINGIVGGGAVTAATNVLYSGSPNWADGTNIPNYGVGAGVESAIDQVVSDLAGTAGTGGIGKVGGPAIAGSLGTDSVVSLIAGQMSTQISTLLTAVNSRVRRVGDTMAGNLTPDVTGTRQLGTSGSRFAAVYSEVLNLLALSNTVTPLALQAYTEQRADLAALYGIGSSTQPAAAICQDGHYLPIGLEFRDEFLYAAVTGLDTLWTRTTAGGGTLTVPSGTNVAMGGLVRFTVSDANGDVARIATAPMFDTNSVRAHALHVRVRRLQLAGASRTFSIGLVRSDDGNRYVIFKFTANGDWQAEVRNGIGDTPKTENFAGTAGTDFVRLDIIFRPTSNVIEFLVDGASHTIDHIGGVPQPTAGAAFALYALFTTTAGGGGSANVDVDWVQVNSGPE